MEVIYRRKGAHSYSPAFTSLLPPFEQKEGAEQVPGARFEGGPTGQGEEVSGE